MDQGADLTARQAVQSQAGLVGEGMPRRLELGSESEHGQDSVVQPLVEELPEELQSRCVHPVQVFDDEQDRPAGSARVQPLQHGPERFFPLANRRQHWLGKVVRDRQGEQRGPQRHRLGPGQAILLQSLDQPVESGVGGCGGNAPPTPLRSL